MRLLHVAAFVCLTACAALPAYGQYGLYGAPDMLRLQPVQWSAPAGGYVAPSGFQVEQSAPLPGEAGMVAGGTMPLPPVSQGNVQPAPAGPAYSPSYRPVTPIEAGAGVAAGPAQPCSGPLDEFRQAVYGSGCGCCPWYGYVQGLYMTRDEGNKLWTTYQTKNQGYQMMNTQDASTGWEGGGEICFGHSFCCGQWAVEAKFWTLREFTGSASASYAGDTVSTPLTTGFVLFDNLGANCWFDHALQHTLQRTDELQDVEINLVRCRLLGGCGCGCGAGCGAGCGGCGCGPGGGCAGCGGGNCGCSSFGLDIFAGLRFFHFRDDLVWGAEATDCTWAYFRDNVQNTFVGPQIGLNLQYQVCSNLRLFVAPSVGLYDNFIQNDFYADAYDNGRHYVGTQDTYPGLTYPAHNHCNTISVLSQIDVGLDWQLTQHFGVRCGYRVLAATGVALSDAQIPPYLNDIPAINDIDRNGHLLLHGAFAGVTFCF